MLRKSFIWLILLISVFATGLVASGCAKRQTVKEEMGGKQAAVAKAPGEAKKEGMQPGAEAPMAMQKPKEEAPANAAPVVKPREEALAPAKAGTGPQPAPIDISSIRVQFAFDDYSLSPQSEERLGKVAEWLKSNPDAKVQIQGNTCDIGTAEYNLALGQERADSARKYLQELGVDSGRLSTISYGEEKPRVPNSDEQNRSMNRRDEFAQLR